MQYSQEILKKSSNESSVNHLFSSQMTNFHVKLMKFYYFSSEGNINRNNNKQKRKKKFF